MKYLLILVLIFGVTSLGAIELKSYENSEKGFTLSYPEDWQIEEIDLGIVLSSVPGFFDLKEKGAGVFLFIQNIEDMSMENTPQTNRDIWEEMKKSNPAFEEKSAKDIQWLGKVWLVTEFHEKNDDSNAVFYILMDNDLVYFVGCVYHPSAAEADFRPVVEEILKTIRFKTFEKK